MPFLLDLNRRIIMDKLSLCKLESEGNLFPACLQKSSKNFVFLFENFMKAESKMLIMHTIHEKGIFQIQNLFDYPFFTCRVSPSLSLPHSLLKNMTPFILHAGHFLIHLPTPSLFIF